MPSKQRYKVFSNIPFQITADIIKKITEDNNSAEEIFLIVQKEAAKKGVFVLTAGKDVIRLLPPLTISKEELKEGLNVIIDILKK